METAIGEAIARPIDNMKGITGHSSPVMPNAHAAHVVAPDAPKMDTTHTTVHVGSINAQPYR